MPRKSQTEARPVALAGQLFLVLLVSSPPAWSQSASEGPVAVTEGLLSIAQTDPSIRAWSYRPSAVQSALLEEVEHGCFLYLWKEVGHPAQLAKDRRYTHVASTAGVGFQLSSLPIGVERGWVSREAAEARAIVVLRSLLDRIDNKKFGVYLHFVDHNTGGIPAKQAHHQASTVDHALLVAGAIPAASYFGGEVAQLVDQMLESTEWSRFMVGDDGFMSFGWRTAEAENASEVAEASEITNLDGPGAMRPWTWHNCSDEERLVYFLAAGPKDCQFAVAPTYYYRLHREVKQYAELPPFVVPWNGSMFQYFFSHCWINYRQFGPDDPSQFDVETVSVDWWENSRRATLAHRQHCADRAHEFPNLAVNRWGLSPCMGLSSEGKDSYLVQDVPPNLSNTEEWQRGTIAPYAAGTAIMFAPEECLAALTEFRHLKNKAGRLLAWRELTADGEKDGAHGYGFVDSFNIPQDHASDDNIAIDVGPMLLGIENYRTGLIWKLFHDHAYVQRCVQRLQLAGS